MKKTPPATLCCHYFIVMNLNSFPLRHMYAKHLTVHCHVACFPPFLLILPAYWSKDRSQVLNQSSEGLSQQATLSASLWRTSKAGNLFILLEKAPCERQTWQFGLCAALSLSVVKGGNSLKNGKEKQGAGVDGWVILVWNPSFLAKEKKQVGRLRAMSSSQLLNKPSDHSDKHLHESIKCSRETWHQPLWRTDTELPDSIILWDFI